MQRLETGKPHHGVAIPFGDRVLLTAAEPDAEDGDLPTAVTVRSRTGEELQRFGDCPELHGEAAGDGWAAFACEDGILLLEGRDALTATKLPYPEPAGARTWTLHADEAGRRLIGLYGDDRLLVVDRAARGARTIALGRDAGAAALRSARSAAVLTTDGRVHRVDLDAGRVTDSARAASRFALRSRRPAPQVVAGAGRVLVSDPARGRVRVLRGDLERVRTIAVGGAPQRLALVGAP